MKSYRIAVTALMIAACSTVSFAQNKKVPDYKPFIEKYKKIFSDEIKQFQIAGLSIAVVDGDSVVWCEGFGYYNQKEKKKVTGHTPFNIGSICKTFTALSVLQLMEQKKLKLDDSYRKYVPEFKMKSRFGSIDSITIRNMMTHHAGIPDFIKDKMFEHPPYFTKVLDYVNDDYATFAPNTIFSYSNAGISLLGNLIEKVSKQSYYDYLQKNILNPLNMNESGLLRGELPESVDLGYTGSEKEMKELQVIDAPAGCIYSTAYDMTKYIKAMLNKGSFNNHQLISKKTFDEMVGIQNKNIFLDLGSTNGLTWQVYFNDAGKCIEHAGGTINHRAELCIAPEAGIGIIIMSNSANGGRCMFRENYEMFSEIMKIKGMKPIVHQKPVPNVLHPEHHFVYQNNVQPTYVSKSKTELEKYAGKYGTFGMFYNIEMRNEKLWTNIWGHDWYLLPVENNEFVSSNDTSFKNIDLKNRYYFETVNDNFVFIQTNETGSHQIFGEKIEKIKPNDVWMKRVGDYVETDDNKNYQMFSDFSLHYENDVLYLRGKVHIEFGPPEFAIPFKIINDNLAVIYGYDRFCGTALQFEKESDGKELMKFVGFHCIKK